MAIQTSHGEVRFGIGDTVKVHQKLTSQASGKGDNTQVFEGVVIAIKGRQVSKTITVRRIGEHQVGIERIFPLASPSLLKVELVRQGMKGSRRAKLYYVRVKHKKEVELIYTRAKRKESAKKDSNSKPSKAKSRKKG